MALKQSSDQYRAGGERVLFLDQYGIDGAKVAVQQIRADGFKAWRTGHQVWVLDADCTQLAQSRDWHAVAGGA
jgi:hypothetical protein